MTAHKALVVVDLQNDFMPDGALGVARGDEVVAPLSELARRFAAAGRPVFITRDWHPAETTHFQAQGGPWPPHCVQDTPGARFHPGLVIPASAVIVSKGAEPDEDAYSAFQARDASGRLLPDLLRDAGVGHLVIGGLATDYCVRFTVADAVRQGFRATVVADAVRAVDLEPGDGRKAVQEMVDAGATLADSDEVDPNG